MTNPLIDITDLPDFKAMEARHISPMVDQCLSQGRSLLAELLQQTQPSWQSFIEPLSELDNTLQRGWSVVSHMNAVMNNDELRDEYNANLPKLSDYHTELGQNSQFYQVIQSIRDRETSLSPAQQKSLDDSILGFKLSGVALPEDKKQRFKAVSQQLSQLSSQFSDNVLDATQAWYKHITDETLLAGLPDSAKEMAAQTAQQRDLEGWVFTLDFPSYLAVMSYADHRELRETMYQAYSTRASNQAQNQQYDNTQIMKDILRLRQEEAELLGYNNFAEVSFATKMADTPEQVVQFLQDLAQRSKPFAEQEMQQVRDYAVQLGIDDLAAWDIAWVSEKIKQERFQFSDEDLKPYFPVDQVIDGLFELVSQLYQVRIEPQQNTSLWHSDVRFYHIYNDQGELQARFYLDLYARQHKRGGAWMSDFCGRYRQQAHLQTPVAFMTCNSSPPVGGKPALFTHDEVITLFHEFGHGLHHMLTQVDFPDVSGINGVEWDAVELPSQFMENWCWEREVLNKLAKHWETGEPLPGELFDKMQQARHFQSAMAMVRQLEFSLFDLQLHRDTSACEGDNLYNIVEQVRKQVAVVEYPNYNRMPNSFGHIFAGGYAAGYYSYKWAEVLSADAYARFEEEGLFNPEIGLSFKQEILEQGGSRPAMESFKAFRQREPDIDALLRHSGLQAA